MKKFLNLIREPILLFFILGIVLFVLYLLATDYFDRRNRQIVISQGQIELLVETFAKTWNRSPTESELNAQVENFIKDEIFFKEAVAMGLDKTDPAIKRRLRQLMELMMDDMATVYPSEDQLKKYLSENPDKFREDPAISFRHIYFSTDNREEATEILTKLKTMLPVDESKFGSLSLIPDQFSGESFWEIERLFGRSFTQKIFNLESGVWHGPIESAYGYHLVFVSEITKDYIPELSEIWDEVEREWALERKMEIKEQQYQKIKEKYTVRIEENE